jgi:ESCRT-I complex subunit TSG101
LQSDVERNTTLLQEKNEEMASVLSRMENNDDLDIDDAVTPTAPLYKQYVIEN